MSIAAYVTYVLLNLDGSGIQPYHQIQYMGMDFEGGNYQIGMRFLGYLSGDTTNLPDTLKMLQVWGVNELTSTEALAWVDQCIPVNSTLSLPDGTVTYYGPAALGSDGKVIKPTSSSPY